MRALLTGVLSLAVAAALATPAAGAPTPADPAYTRRDLQNIADAYGRIDGEGHRRMDQTPHHLRSLCGEPARFGAAIYTSVHCPVGIVRCD